MRSILHLIPTMEGGGAERQLAMLAPQQARRGWCVHVGLRRGGVHSERLRDGNVTVHELGDLPGPHPLLVARISRAIRAVRPDIVQTWLPQMDLVGGMSARALSVPWVLSERSSEREYRTKSLTLWFRARLGRRADALVANSPDGAEYWRNIGAARGKTSVITNAVDIAAIRETAPAPSMSGLPLVLYVGRLTMGKAPDVFVAALARLARTTRFRALLLGAGPLAESLRSHIRDEGLADYVKLLPYQSSWWGLLRSAAVLVATSYHEGQPNVVLEAMAAECPLVVSDISQHRAVLDDDSAVWASPGDATGFADAISKILTNQPLARERATRAFHRLDDVHVEQVVERYLNLYESIIHTSRSKGL